MIVILYLFVFVIMFNHVGFMFTDFSANLSEFSISGP